jgi:phage gp37-like protein
VPTLTVRNQITEVQRALHECLALAFLRRLAPVADVAALRTTYGSPLDRALCYVTAEARVYRWSKYSTAADDGLNVLAPNSLVPGRWLRVESTLTYGPNMNAPLHARPSGVCQAVEFLELDEGTEDQLERVLGNTPSILIHWKGDRPLPHSLVPGAVYKTLHDFTVIVYSQSLRGPTEALWGSPLPSELAADPGLNSLLSELRYVLAGISLGTPGVIDIELGPARVTDSYIEERLVRGEVDFEVRVSFVIPDEDLVPCIVDVQPRLAEKPAALQTFDVRNYVAQGFYVQPGAGLAWTYPPGIAFIAGSVVSSTPPPVTFPASSDVYRDLSPDGTLTYTAVGLDEPAPAPSAGALRIGRTRTSATDILDDAFLCSSSFAWGGPMRIP